MRLRWESNQGKECAPPWLQACNLTTCMHNLSTERDSNILNQNPNPKPKNIQHMNPSQRMPSGGSAPPRYGNINTAPTCSRILNHIITACFRVRVLKLIRESHKKWKSGSCTCTEKYSMAIAADPLPKTRKEKCGFFEYKGKGKEGAVGLWEKGTGEIMGCCAERGNSPLV